jgi:hypothetical protein
MKILEVPKQDLKSIFNVFIRRIGIFVIFVFILFFDSIYFTEHVTNSQLPINIIMGIGFLVMYYRANTRTKELMIYAVILGFGGEYLFSRGLDMYTYRLENVPLYVPFGHAALYGRIFMFSKAPVVRKYHKAVEELFAVLIILFATIYLFFFEDVGGTAFGAWKWPSIGFDTFRFLPSNNPPSGIPLFYFLLDIGCFFIYTKRHKTLWKRLKNIRKINNK